MTNNVMNDTTKMPEMVVEKLHLSDIGSHEKRFV